MGVGSVKGLVVQIGGDTSKLEQTLKSANTSIKNLSKELKSVNALLKFDTKNVTISTQKQGLLKEQISQTEKKLEALRKAQEEADNAIANGTQIDQENYRALQREIALTEKQLDELKKEASNWTKAGQALENFGNKLKSISSKASALGEKLTKTLTVPIVGAATIAIKQASDFESAWTGVTKTVDGTDEQLKNLRQGIIDLSEKIPSSTKEIAGVAEAAGQLGIKTDDILAFTKVMIDLGNSTNLSADEAASALAKFANITNMSASDYSKLGSVIVDLGNNFATTEADIVAMGTRLAATGELTGLSQSQIMALATAMSSVGIEAEAGGSAMSKLLKKIQVAVETGSDELKDFAKVAGVSGAEFKKAFEKDAVQALSMFLSGLQDTERNGKSAIAILDDMEIKEIRLSNTILSLSNAHELLNDAVNTANQAWDDNSALQNEANKRYETFASKVEVAKNKAQNLGASLGEKLLPHVIKLLDKINELVEWFGNLSESEQEQIIKLGALVAAAGPVLTILGKVGSGAGTAISALGKLSKSIGDVTTKTGGLSGALTSVPGLVGIAVATVTAAYFALEKIFNDINQAFIDNSREQNKSALEAADSIQKEVDSYKALTDASTNMMNSSLSQIKHEQNLKDELDKIVDTNGKIKEGYEARASFITKELSESTGVEIKIVDGVIKKYDDLSKKIQETIDKQRLDAIMKKLKTDYDNALGNIDELQKKRDNAVVDYVNAASNKLTTTEDLNKLKNAMTEADNLYDKALKNISNYEYCSELAVKKGSEAFEEISNRVNYSITGTSNDSVTKVKDAINIMGTHLHEYVKDYQTTADEADLIQIQHYNNQLSNLTNHLVEMTNTQDELSGEQIEAWRMLADRSFTAYQEGIMALPEDVRKRVQDATGVIADETPAAGEVAKTLGDTVITNIDKSVDAKNAALETLTQYLNGLSDDDKRTLLKQIGMDDADIVLDELNKGDLSEQHGIEILNGLYRGLDNKTIQGNILGAASRIANAVNNAFKGCWKINSPSKVMQEMADYYLAPIPTTFEKQKKTIQSIARKFAGSINDSVMDGFSKNGLSASVDVSNLSSNKVYQVNTNIYTQSMSEAQMNNTFNYINKKMGLIGG